MLYLVPTPIGNLEDITFRSLRILKEVDIVLAEDTRISKKLFLHYNIDTPLRSHHTHNEHQSSENIVQQILAGANVALISDAGTPSISDPGFVLVKACIQAGIKVECLPGATAIIPALVCSGLPSNRFYFEGFLPHKKGRQTRLLYLAELSCTFIIYESPHRLEKCIMQLIEYCGDQRKAVVCREISKMFEEYARGTLKELHLLLLNKQLKSKGEIVIVVAGKEKVKKKKKI
ncbi:MAG: 16S rRNA (cytidine(1402)-2'-O)-methyltransferase [Saprospiraceae bacterium]|nr:16S rRNA (cytidine(1402)-2'-O)-methyltransferase [Saprospiraceae bacterium]